MSEAEDYLLLGLRLDRHIDGFVDAYYGPPELKEQVAAEEPAPPEQLVHDARRLRDSLNESWLRDQVQGCLTTARVLAGERISYSDEVEESYGVRPQWTPDEVLAEAHGVLDALLPGDGSLFERRLEWRRRHLCAGDKAVAAASDLLPLFRRATQELVSPLPDGERVTLEAVTDEPWWAFNYYLGDLHSRVAINTDVPTTGIDLLHLVSHEVYPGHHTEQALKEQHLVRWEANLEQTITVVPGPQAVITEGIAEIGGDLVSDDAVREEAYAIVRRHGVELADPELAEQIARAVDALRGVSVNAALMIHEQGVSLEEAQSYVERWTLNPPEQAAQSVRFVTDPTWRAYAITYVAGRSLCAAYVGDRIDRFRQLLTEQVRIRELSSR